MSNRRSDTNLAEKTIQGMKRLSADIKLIDPHTIVIATPHNLRLAKKIGVVTAENSAGSWGTDDASSISLGAKCDVEFATRLLSSALAAKLPVIGANYGTASGPLSNMPMDWGTIIPLWFFLKLNRLTSKVVIVTPSREIALEQNYRFGAKIAELAEHDMKKRVVFVASADQAHTHNESGPYGFSTKAVVYDRKVLEAVRANALSDILKFRASIVEEAKPDSLWQMAMLAGALSRVEMRATLHSYEVAGYFGMLCASYTRS